MYFDTPHPPRTINLLNRTNPFHNATSIEVNYLGLQQKILTQRSSDYRVPPRALTLNTGRTLRLPNLSRTNSLIDSNRWIAQRSWLKNYILAASINFHGFDDSTTLTRGKVFDLRWLWISFFFFFPLEIAFHF
ncbi:hypothetical protein CDAR_166721 [Caerostris darwini]|uniref:Uncharacterized protein n=1 Tax=Caerostris darwini TaxID=1538125 RepID=A0AAV4QS14_9ARAC|nr:hypothetical protein CDAR_166721 [Caerostris darwini]